MSRPGGRRAPGRHRSARCTGRRRPAGLRNVSRNRSLWGIASRLPPGSVTATKPSPTSLPWNRPTRWCSASQKWARNASVSVVVPDLVAMMRRVVARVGRVLGRPDGRRVGGIEHPDRAARWPTGDSTAASTSGARRAAPHAAHDDVRVARTRGSPPRRPPARRSRPRTPREHPASRAGWRWSRRPASSVVHRVVSRAASRLAQRSSTASLDGLRARSPAGRRVRAGRGHWRVVASGLIVVASGASVRGRFGRLVFEGCRHDTLQVADHDLSGHGRDVAPR